MSNIFCEWWADEKFNKEADLIVKDHCKWYYLEMKFDLYYLSWKWKNRQIILGKFLFFIFWKL